MSAQTQASVWPCITDLMVPALLDPDGCKPHEWVALVEAGLGRVSWSDPDDRNMCSHTRSRSAGGERFLAEAQRVAGGLPAAAVHVLREMREDGEAEVGPVLQHALTSRGLVAKSGRGSTPGCAWMCLTPPGKLVLALCERKEDR